MGSLPTRARQRAGLHDPCGPPSNREHAVTLGTRPIISTLASLSMLVYREGTERSRLRVRDEPSPRRRCPPTVPALPCLSWSPKAAEARPRLPFPPVPRSPAPLTPPCPLPSQPYRLHGGGARVLLGGGSAPRAATAAPGGGGRTRPR